MDYIVSPVLSTFTSLKTALQTLGQLSGDYNDLQIRISQSPGIPSFPTTDSHWPNTVPESNRLLHTSETHLPERTDILIIGSGITGTLVARALLEHPKTSDLRIVIVEARDVCSGATGRNGGHIKCDPHLIYHKYEILHGKEFAKKATRFNMAHVDELIRISEKVGGEPSTETRRVETVDAYFDSALFQRACAKVKTFEADMSVESQGIKVLDGPEAQKTLGLSPLCVGAITGHAGAINPYKLVTTLLSSFEEKYPNRFNIVSRCPIKGIKEPTSAEPFYTLQTEKGQITTSHIIHATNAHVGHLVPGLRAKVFPLRQTMTAQSHRSLAQAPGSSAQPGGRSFSLMYSEGFDYLTQRPDGTVMLGGGFAQSPQQGMAEVGISTDDSYDPTGAAHVCGALDVMFKDPEHPPSTNDANAENRVKSIWSGSLGISADALPWVGRLPTRLTGRKAPPADTQSKIASPGEWVSAGYSGEGMVNAALCAKALAMMIIKPNEDNVSSWFPEQMRVTEKRCKKADPSALLQNLWA
ncbi:FAD-dependent oxidoreductase, putative [Rhizoctonia solani AG-3 Rhs1AP]|uniref:FAD-dependent oxidoreductase, putative n=1 Tax=Rhizoctonia solani AG-3 Rhs1AP TaxID=1086054 RepID=X8JGM9_9AGAM|nr:FAD-dependent oxidoreductase, putative [Rhizoctonia solani AG-3 Rhs1AP]